MYYIRFENKYQMTLGQTKPVCGPSWQIKGLFYLKHFIWKCAFYLKCQSKSLDRKCSVDVARQYYTCHTHQELWYSLIGLHASCQHTGLKNKHEEQRRRKKATFKKKNLYKTLLSFLEATVAL